MNKNRHKLNIMPVFGMACSLYGLNFFKKEVYLILSILANSLKNLILLSNYQIQFSNFKNINSRNIHSKNYFLSNELFYTFCKL